MHSLFTKPQSSQQIRNSQNFKSTIKAGKPEFRKFHIPKQFIKQNKEAQNPVTEYTTDIKISYKTRIVYIHPDRKHIYIQIKRD